MNNQQKQQVQTLRYGGMTYAEIAENLGLSLNTVKSFCRRKGIGVVVRNATVSTRDRRPVGDTAESIEHLQPRPRFCAQCGMELEQKPKTKPRRFCSGSCRHAWWNNHRDQMKKRAIYYLTCQHCGRDFESYGDSKRKYCSHACYIEARYGQQ